MKKQFVDEVEKAKIIDRVQKLMALGNIEQNPYEEEVAMALRMAKKYMAKYGLSMSEIEVKEAGDDNISIEESERVGVIRAWEKTLALVVGEICDVKPIMARTGKGECSGYRRRKQVVQFIGFLEDVKLAKTLYDTLQQVIWKMGLSAYNTTHERNSYQVGLVTRLLDRAREESREVKDESIRYGALVVVKEARIDKWIREKIGRLGRSGNTPSGGIDGEAYRQGYVDGNRVDLHNRPKVTV